MSYIAFILITIMTVFGTSISNLISAELHQAAKNRRQIQSYYLAEAGLNRAVFELTQNPTWQGDRFYEELETGTYDMEFDSGTGILTVTGRVGNEAVPATIAKKTLTAVLIKSSVSIQPFQHAAFGDSGISMTGNGKTYSYPIGNDADIGTNSTSSNAISMSGNARVNGDAYVGVGGVPSTVIETTGNARITGDKAVLDSPYPLVSVEVPDDLINGPNYPDMGSVSISGNSSTTITPGKYDSVSVSGNARIYLEPGEYSFNSISVTGNGRFEPNGLVKMSVYNSISVSGNARIYLEPGEHFFNSISVTGNGRFEANGPVKIFVDEQINFSGNGTNQGFATSKEPVDFKVFGTDNCTDVSVHGNGNLYGTIYAPKADIKFTGNGKIYGALVGYKVSFTGNGKIYFDESLRDDEDQPAGAGGSSYELGSSWGVNQ